MPKTQEYEKPVMTLIEKVNEYNLDRVLSSPDIDPELKGKLVKYKSKINNGYIQVHYNYSKNLQDKGRLYARDSLSLQNIKSEVRHFISNDIYEDIDIDNCHPTLIEQYCEKNEIETPYLSKYNENREEILEQIMEHHNVTRTQAKKLMLRLCYLGAYKFQDDNMVDIIPKEKPLKVVEKFSDELKLIAIKICDLNKELYKKVKEDPEKINKKAATMSIFAQILEDKCLMSMYEYFKSNKYVPGVLCFDGIMIEKNKNQSVTKKTLKECEKTILKTTGYKVKLTIKPMDKVPKFEIPKHSMFVKDDSDAVQKIFKIVGKESFRFSKFKGDKDGDLYIYCKDTGMFEIGRDALNKVIMDNEQYLHIIKSTSVKTNEIKTESYGRSARMMNQLHCLFEAQSRDLEWLERTELSSLGFLLFKNGIYDMRNNKFKEEFDPTIVFHAQVPHLFPERNEKYIKKVNKIIFDNMFENPKQIKIALAASLAGEIGEKKFYFCPGQTNAGKSFLISLMKRAFGSYIGIFNAENLAYNSENDSKDAAAHMRWALILRFCRIIFSSEVNMKKKINSNNIKKHSSGGRDNIVGRSHGKTEREFIPNYTVFCMTNDIPQIYPMDKATIGRLEYIEFPYQFVPEDKVGENPKYKKQDPSLDDKFNNKKMMDAFIWIILDAYQEYCEDGLPDFDTDIKGQWLDGQDELILFEELFDRYFERTGDENDTITNADIAKFKKNLPEELKTMSAKKFCDTIREKLGLLDYRTAKERGWKCVKKRNIIDDVDF